jgi:hypothetical protein
MVSEDLVATTTDKMFNRCAAITALVILNFIGCGLLPKGAAFRSKKQAIVPKLAWKSSSANHALQRGRGFAARKLSIDHLCYDRFAIHV